MKCLVTER